MIAIATKQSCVRGYHIYKNVGQLLLVKSWCVEEKDEITTTLCCVSIMESVMKDKCRRWSLAQENIALSCICMHNNYACMH